MTLKSFIKLFTMVIAISLFSLCLYSCGGSTDDDDTGTTTTSEANAEALAQSVLNDTVQATTYASTSLSVPPAVKYLPGCDTSVPNVTTCTINCATSGTMTFTLNSETEEASITYAACVNSIYTTNGTISNAISTGSSTEDVTMTYDDFSIVNSTTGDTMTHDGTVALSIDTTTNLGTITWTDFAGTDSDSTAYTVTGTMYLDITENTLYGTMTTVYGSSSIVCTITESDPIDYDDTEAEIEAAIDAACTIS